MTEVEPSRQARAAETKKRRTREKLIQAADYVLREDGFDATVEAIAEEAGVSTATFYTFYRSRDQLCVDALGVLVLDQLERAAPPTFRAAAETYLRLTADRTALAHAAAQHIVAGYDDTDDLFERLARCLADKEMLMAGVAADLDADTLHAGTLALGMAAMHLLIMETDEDDPALLEEVVRRACGLPVT